MVRVGRYNLISIQKLLSYTYYVPDPGAIEINITIPTLRELAHSLEER